MRIESIEKNLQQHIAQIIIQDLNDPKIGFVTVTSVKTSKDLDFAKVYINVLGAENKTKSTLKELEKATGFIKTRLSKTLKMRKIPKLKFILDTTLENALKLTQLIESVKK